MKLNKMKTTVVLTLALMLLALTSAWAGMMGGGRGGNTTTTMMGGGGRGGTTTTITGGGENTTTTIFHGGMGGGGMMGGSSRMGQFEIADLDNDKVPEIVTIVSGRTLVIMDNEGNVISSKPLPAIPELTNERLMVSGLEIADMDGDGTPEIVTTYYVTNNNSYSGSGTSTKNGTYLVTLDNQGNLKNYKQLDLPYSPY
jgi:hypothetical protein